MKLKSLLYTALFLTTLSAQATDITCSILTIEKPIITLSCTIPDTIDTPIVPVPPTVSYGDPGHGSWRPTSNRLIADQSGSSDIYKTTFAPGCLNGGEPPSSSSSGCAASSSFNGFVFGSGNVLGIRYKSKSVLSSSVRYLRINSGDGGNLGQSMKAWISIDPLATYDNVMSSCRWTSTTTLYAATGPGQCLLHKDTQYYLFMSVDDPSAGYRYKIDELSADFN